jgi:hypothetical protein
MRSSHLVRISSLIAAVTALPSVSHGQAVPQAPAFVIEALPERLMRKIQTQKDMLRQFGLADPGKTPKGVINTLKIWTTEYPQIRVCFFAGSQPLRARIAKVAMEWKGAAPGLVFDFGSTEDPRMCAAGEVNHIRIGFRHVGYWSLVGQDSIKLAGQDEQSMNFQGFDASPPKDAEFHATVLHEFGHAIGLEHEHQNPLSKCKEEFDWDQIYTWLAGPPNYWSKDQVDFNMGALNEQGLLTSSFDNKSVMLYTFPGSFFKQGEKASCYNPPNDSLSGGDRDIVAALYPEVIAAKIKLQSDIKTNHLDLTGASEKAAGAKSGIADLVRQYMP